MKLNKENRANVTPNHKSATVNTISDLKLGRRKRGMWGYLSNDVQDCHKSNEENAHCHHNHLHTTACKMTQNPEQMKETKKYIDAGS